MSNLLSLLLAAIAGHPVSALALVVVSAILLLIGHYVSDYVLQVFSKKMANKANDFGALQYHVLVYSASMFVFSLFVFSWPAALAFVYFNGAAHLFIDLFTSKASHSFFGKWLKGWMVTGNDSGGNVPRFFLVLGLDQMLHYIVLALTFAAFYGR